MSTTIGTRGNYFRGRRSGTSSRSGSSPPVALHTGGFPAGEWDGTFGAEQAFIKAPERANTSPVESPQYFGTSARSVSAEETGS